MIRVIDLETTGSEPEEDAIIEIASIDLTADGGVTNPMQTYVDPGRPIPPHISGVHHTFSTRMWWARPSRAGDRPIPWR